MLNPPVVIHSLPQKPVVISEERIQQYLGRVQNASGLALALVFADEIHKSAIVKTAVAFWWMERIKTNDSIPSGSEVRAFIEKEFGT